jgi:predicted DNA-binding transcriptional regulator AlpA
MSHHDPNAHKKPPGPASPRGEINGLNALPILRSWTTCGNETCAPARSPGIVRDPDQRRVLDRPSRAEAASPSEAPTVTAQLLLWGWPAILATTGIPRSTLEREIAAKRFPAPCRRIGRRPFWKPADVIRWAEGGKP